jgi:hypothetical protein
VITFDLGVLDSMEALGEDVQGLPQGGSLPEQFAEYRSDEYVNAGAMKEPDLEAVAEAAPDLIIISGRTAEFYDELSEIAPTVDLSIDETDPLASFTERSGTLGAIFGKEAEVEERLAAIDEQIAETEEQAAGAGTAMFLLTNAGEVNAYGPALALRQRRLRPAGARVRDRRPGRRPARRGRLLRGDRRGGPGPPLRPRPRHRDRAVRRRGRAAGPRQRTRQRHRRRPAGPDHLPRQRQLYVVGFGLNNLPSMITEVQDSLS